MMVVVVVVMMVVVHHLRVGGSNARDGNGDGQGNNGKYLLHGRFPLERLSKDSTFSG
jgi:hypothetical protein